MPKTILFVMAVTAVLAVLAACGGNPTTTPTPLPSPTSTPEPSPTIGPTATPRPAVNLRPGPVTDELLEELSGYVESTMSRYNIPGMAVVVIQGGEVVFEKGFGVKELGGEDLVTPDTIFGIGSLGKPMTSMMIATLVDDGLIGWDTRVVDIIPQFQLSDPEASEKVEVRHLLSHTTGLPNTHLLLFFSGLSPEEYIEFLQQMPLNAQPGEQRIYQNEAYAIGGYAGAIAAGADYGNNLVESYIGLMKERVFDPIGMSTATFSLSEAEASPDHATPHFASINGNLGQDGFDVTPTGFLDLPSFAPAGTVKASATDVGRFLVTMMAEGVAPHGKRVVSENNLAETLTEQVSIEVDSLLDSAGGALGWRLADYQGVPIATHNAAIGGFTSTMAFVPGADLGVVVMSNLDLVGSAGSRNVQFRLFELFFGLEAKVDAIAQVELDQISNISGLFDQLSPVDPEVVAPFLGQYQALGVPYTIELRDGRLWFSQGTFGYVELLSASDGSYVAISGGDFLMTPFQFLEREPGEITLLISGTIEAPKLK